MRPVRGKFRPHLFPEAYLVTVPGFFTARYFFLGGAECDEIGRWNLLISLPSAPLAGWDDMFNLGTYAQPPNWI